MIGGYILKKFPKQHTIETARLLIDTTKKWARKESKAFFKFNLGILLMFISGARIGEVVTLKREDFETDCLKAGRIETMDQYPIPKKETRAGL